MKQIIVTVTGHLFESFRVEDEHVGEFQNDESGDWDAIPSTFLGRAIGHRGRLSNRPTVLYGIDVRGVNITE
jgi:hypothetical protein